MHYLTGILGGHNFIYEQDMQGVHACEKKINNIFCFLGHFIKIFIYVSCIYNLSFYHKSFANNLLFFDGKNSIK